MEKKKKAKALRKTNFLVRQNGFALCTACISPSRAKTLLKSKTRGSWPRGHGKAPKAELWNPWEDSRPGWTGLCAAWSGWRSPCSLQGGWARRPRKVPSHPNRAGVLWAPSLSRQEDSVELPRRGRRDCQGKRQSSRALSCSFGHTSRTPAQHCASTLIPLSQQKGAQLKLHLNLNLLYTALACTCMLTRANHTHRIVLKL